MQASEMNLLAESVVGKRALNAKYPDIETNFDSNRNPKNDLDWP